MKTPITTEQFISRLKAKGLKSTPQRLAVHSAMMELGHASADMVAAWIYSNGNASITVASIYNVLSQLAAAGIYSRRTSTCNKMFFDINPTNHCHLYDSVNDSYRDIQDDDITDIVADHFRKARFKGFKVDSIDIQLICHPTRKNTKKQE